MNHLSKEKIEIAVAILDEYVGKYFRPFHEYDRFWMVRRIAIKFKHRDWLLDNNEPWAIHKIERSDRHYKQAKRYYREALRIRYPIRMFFRGLKHKLHFLIHS